MPGCHGYSLSLEKQPLHFLRLNIPPLAALLIDSLAFDKHGRLAVFTHGDAEEPDSKKEERWQREENWTDIDSHSSGGPLRPEGGLVAH